jgi:hypothetical protein
MDVLLYLRDFVVVNYTLEHTNARWMARVTDDVIINFAKLGQLINRLELRHDPLKEFVLKAQCVDFHERRWWGPYPQGGSGFVLSRFACEISKSHQIPMLRALTSWEDTSIGFYMAQMNVPFMIMAGNNFIGHTPDGYQWGVLSKLGTMPLCSSIPLAKLGTNHCGRFLTPLNEVVFVHLWPSPNVDRVIEVAEKYFQAPSWVMWDNSVGGDPKFCREENATVRDQMSFWNSPRVKWGNHSWY